MFVIIFFAILSLLNSSIFEDINVLKVSSLTAMDENSKEKYNEVQQLAQKLEATASIVRGIDNALDKISGCLPGISQKTQEPHELNRSQNLKESSKRMKDEQTTRSQDVIMSPNLTQKLENEEREGNKYLHSSHDSLREADATNSQKIKIKPSSDGKFESIMGLLQELDATLLASEVQSGTLHNVDICELLPPQRATVHPLCLNPVICNNCKENGCCASSRPESSESFPKCNSPVTVRSLVTERTDETPFVRCEGLRSSFQANSFKHHRERPRSQSMCVKMNLIPRNPPKVKTVKEQSNASANAKQNSVRWRENTIIEESNTRNPTIANHREMLTEYQYSTNKFKDVKYRVNGRENNPSMSPHRERTPQHIRDILLELPPIHNNLQERPIDSSDFCGWLSELESMQQEVNSPGNHQIVKRTNRKLWYNPRTVQETRGRYYGVQGNHRLPHLYESACSKFKALPKAGAYNWNQEESAKESYDEETSSLDLGEDLYVSKVHSQLITLPIDSSINGKRKRPKQPKLPPLKCTALMKTTTGDPSRIQWGNDHSHGVLEEISVDNGYKRDTRRTNTPVVEILKPLPFKETKQTKQLMNWCNKNVGPLKIPALDLDFMSDWEPHTVRKEYLTGVLQNTPREQDIDRDETRASTIEVKDEETGASDTEDSFSAPNVRQLLNVFNKTSHQKMDIPVCLLGDKIKVTPLYHPHVRTRAETPVKAYRYRGSDVPIDLVRLALRSKTANRGINNVNYLLQNIPQKTCKRSSSKTTRKSLQHEEKVRVSLEKDKKIEQELNKLRKQLKENKRASRMRNGILYGLDLSDYTDTYRSGVARPSSPATPRDAGVNVS